MNEQVLNFIYEKDDDQHPQAITLKTKGEFEQTESILINVPTRFQRITIYKNGLVVDEEMTHGKHIFRFNKKYEEKESGVLYFE